MSFKSNARQSLEARQGREECFWKLSTLLDVNIYPSDLTAASEDDNFRNPISFTGEDGNQTEGLQRLTNRYIP